MTFTLTIVHRDNAQSSVEVKTGYGEFVADIKYDEIVTPLRTAIELAAAAINDYLIKAGE